MIKTQLKNRVIRLYHALEAERSKRYLLCGVYDQRLLMVRVLPLVPCVQKNELQ